MAVRRNAWAKIDVGMGRHPKLVTRPDCDRLLWLCLVLHAKEHSPDDGIVRGLDAAMMRGLWALKAPLKVVQAALAYFVGSGMLLLVHDGYMVKDFIQRQREGGDTPEAHARRQAVYRHRKKVGTVTSLVASRVTSSDARHSDVEVDKEERDVFLAVHDQGVAVLVAGLRAKAKDLAESDGLQVHRLLDAGRVSEAQAIVADLEAVRLKASKS